MSGFFYLQLSSGSIIRDTYFTSLVLASNSARLAIDVGYTAIYMFGYKAILLFFKDFPAIKKKVHLAYRTCHTVVNTLGRKSCVLQLPCLLDDRLSLLLSSVKECSQTWQFLLTETHTHFIYDYASNGSHWCVGKVPIIYIITTRHSNFAIACVVWNKSKWPRFKSIIIGFQWWSSSLSH